MFPPISNSFPAPDCAGWQDRLPRQPRASPRRRLAAGLMALSMAGTVLIGAAPATVWSQSESLPRLGDAAGGDLSPAMERRVGEAIMRDLRRDQAMIDDAEVIQYLNRFASSLANTSPARGFNFEFFALRDASLNAFALPGGFIGVHSGLIVTAQTESELASVLAHEIGHVTQRHVARMLAQNRQGSVLSLATVFLAMLAASSNPQAAAGLVALGGSVYEQQLLSFSRDAEREADRIGLEILREAQFHASDMVAFFGRMQSATRIYDSGAPSYLRTHPLTTERMADIQNRVLEQRYRQRNDSLTFHLVRAKLLALADASVQGLRDARDVFTTRLRQRTFQHEAATWYGLAVVAAQQADWSAARDALTKARATLVLNTREASAASKAPPRSGDAAAAGKLPEKAAQHPFFERLAVQIESASGQYENALAMVDRAIVSYPDSLALRQQKAQVLLAAKKYEEAIGFVDDELVVYRSSLEYWSLLAQAHAGRGNDGLSHWALGQRYAIEGGWQAALEQFKLAQRDKQVGFYTLSQIDSQIKDMQERLRAELERR